MSLLDLAQKLNRIVRAVSGRRQYVDGNITDPYFIGHADNEQLADEVLRKHYQEYIGETGGMPPEAEEDFEEFLSRLEDRYEYFQIIVAEGMFHV